MKALQDVAQQLGVTKVTLRRYIKLLGISPHNDPFDHRVKALDEEQIEALRRAMSRVIERKKKKQA